MNMRPHRPHAPVVDTDAIKAFSETVFGYVDGFVPVRLLSETGTPDQKPRQAFPRVDEVTNSLIRDADSAARDGRGVFVVPGTVPRPGTAKAADIVETCVVLVDLDQGDIKGARDHLALHLGEPSLVVASGGLTTAGQAKVHLYWRLSEAARGEDLSLVARLRAEIAEKVGGDRSFASIHQPIRVPGTIHGKHGLQNLVRLLSKRDLEYDLLEMAEKVSAMPASPGTDAKPSGATVSRVTASAAALAKMPVRAGAQDGITRFEALSRVIGHWVRNVRNRVCSVEEARSAILDHNATMLRPPFAENRVLGDFEAILRKDMEARGWTIDVPSAPAVSAKPNAIAPVLSDDALAETFASAFSARWRHVPALGLWFEWNGQQWKADETRRVREDIRGVCRDAATAALTPGEARRTASEKTLSAVARIAASDPRFATPAAAWEAHPDLINTPAGVVDLLSGEIRPHDPGLLITQMTSARPGTSCPRWSRFLDEITGGDSELRDYLRRLAGYCLSGSTREQVFVFLHGHGANGKSVFLQAIAGVLGTYAATATLDTFMAGRSTRHLSELAGLRGARLVLVPETEAGQAWAEARIKQVTGGEMIRANFMHRDHFEFRPEFKLIIAGNHRPALTGVGEAMRRRLHLVPFNVTVPREKRDPRLLEVLLAERNGILGWMLEGCTEWRRIGLAPPRCVTEAVNAYFAEEDIIGQWMEECCELGSHARETSAALFQSWKAWAEALGHDAGSARRLGQALQARGLAEVKVRGARGRQGIALIHQSSLIGGAA